MNSRQIAENLQISQISQISQSSTSQQQDLSVQNADYKSFASYACQKS